LMLQAAGTGNLRKLAAAGVGNLRKLAARHGHHPPLEQSATTSSLGLSERTSWPWGLYLPPLASPPLSSLLPPPPLDAAVADSPPPPQGSRVSAKLAGINSRAGETNCGGQLGESGGRRNLRGGGLRFGVAKR
jgi:hypothetical protein